MRNAYGRGAALSAASAVGISATGAAAGLSSSSTAI